MSDDIEDKIPKLNINDKIDLGITAITPEIGKTYPLLGIITSILCEDPFIIMINDQIKGTVKITDPDKIKYVKSRGVEEAIFIITIEQILPDHSMVGFVETIIFGKRKEFDA